MIRPWLKFYPSDWRADPRLRMCSLAARGLWIDLMAYMHEGVPYGHLVIDGTVPDIGAIASLVGRPTGEVRRAFSELDARGVFSRNDAGAIYSRRMIRDKAKEDTDRENGKGGGNPKLKPVVNPPHKAQKLDARLQSPERKETIPSLRSGQSDWPQDFREQFWSKYPRKTGKSAAVRRLETIRKSGEVPFRKLIDAVARYAAAVSDPKYVKHPETWLNKGCWDDEAPQLGFASNGDQFMAGRL